LVVLGEKEVYEPLSRAAFFKARTQETRLKKEPNSKTKKDS